MTSNKKEFFSQILLPENKRLWQALAFHAGYLNAAGFLACHRFVSHMTGFGTQIGINLGLNEYLFAFEMFLAPIVFVLGAIYAGTLVDRKLVRNKKPLILRGLVIIVCLNLLVLLGGVNGIFGVFGEPLTNQRDFILLFILTFCCGLQNGLFVSLTSNQIRTTHITGLCTDLGLNLVRSLTLKDHQMKSRELNKNWLRVRTIVAFSAGSMISALICQRMGYWAFLGSSLFAFTILCYIKWIINVNGLVFEDPIHV